MAYKVFSWAITIRKNLKNYKNFVNFYEQLVGESKDRVLGKDEEIFLEKRKDAFVNFKLCLECHKQSMDALTKILADSVINRPMKKDAFRCLVAPLSRWKIENEYFLFRSPVPAAKQPQKQTSDYLIKCVQEKDDSSFLDIFSVPKMFFKHR